MPVVLNFSLYVMRGHSASKTRVTAPVTRASIPRVRPEGRLLAKMMDCRVKPVKPGNDDRDSI
jgi:hypothetical protein